jgi:hypothetical protein
MIYNRIILDRITIVTIHFLLTTQVDWGASCLSLFYRSSRRVFVLIDVESCTRRISWQLVQAWYPQRKPIPVVSALTQQNC